MKYEKPQELTLETVLPDESGGMILIGPKDVHRLRADGKVSPFATGFTNLCAGAASWGRDKALYVADGGAVVKIAPDGKTSSFASGFKAVFGLSFDSKGACVVGDWEDHKIFRVDSAGKVENVAGTGKEGHKDGLATEATFTHPSGVAIDAEGNVYVKESGRQEPSGSKLRVRKITPQGRVSTLAAIDWR